MTFAAELKFEFGKGGHNRSHGSPGWRAGVYSFAYGAQQNLSLTEFCDGVGDFSDRTPEPINRYNHNNVAGTSVVEHGRQAGTSGLGRPGEFVAEDPLRIHAAGLERGELGLRSWRGC